MCNVKQCLDRLDILALHFTKVVKECEFRERCNESIAFQLETKEADNLDGILKAIQRHVDNLGIVRILQRRRHPR